MKLDQEYISILRKLGLRFGRSFFSKLLARTIRYSLVLILSTSFSPAHGQYERDNSWRDSNDQGNRYEGEYSDDIGFNSELEIVSFTGNTAKYSFGQQEVLFVDWFCPDPANIFLKAEELRVFNYYWMESKSSNSIAGWNRFGPWPVDFNLRRSNVTSRNLGLLVFDRNNNRRVFPAYYHNGSEITKSSYYVGQFRLGTEISSGSYSVTSLSEEEAGQQVQSGTISAKPGGVTFPLIVKRAYLPATGWYKMKIELACRNSNAPIVYSFEFFHQQ